ncbi:PAS domain-containing sensor histidine kinase [Stappia sp. TSB10GB4]|uniref:sensor histidine kinase n=1 Tax=Stappia sp. TSB10GB4 TaxID=2003584 RepID=UPI001AD8B05A|nr:PAS domain-containing sensor histidine kinase [Stappia sp. TSB10GB4]
MPMNSQLSTFMALSGLAAASSHLTDARPAWIWAEDGKTLLWANPAGAAFFGVRSLAELSELSGLGRAPARPHIARVAISGPTDRDTTDRLRFYRGLRVMLLTCACRRLDLPDGSSGALIVALDAPANAGDGDEGALVDFLQGEGHVALLYGRDGRLQSSGDLASPPDGATVRAALREAKHAPLRRAFVFGDHLHEAAALTLDSGAILMVAASEGRPIADSPAAAAEAESLPAPAEDAAEAPATADTAAAGGTGIAPESESWSWSESEAEAETPVEAEAIELPAAPAAPVVLRASRGGLFAFASGTRFLPETPAAAAPVAASAGADLDTEAPDAEDSAPRQDEAVAEVLVPPLEAAVPVDETHDEPVNRDVAEAPAGPQGADPESAEQQITEPESPEPESPEPETVDQPLAEAREHAETTDAAEADDDLETGDDLEAGEPASPAEPDEAAAAEVEVPEAEASETEAEAEAEDETEAATENENGDLPVAGATGFAFETRERPVRFAWKMDIDRRFTFISPEFAEALGPQAADVVGLTWEEVAERFGLDPDGRVAAALRRRDTWSGRTVDWPVSGAALRVPVDMAALPAFDRQRVFEGFRGFGVCRIGEALADPEATGLGLALRTPLRPSPADSAAEEEADLSERPGDAAPTEAETDAGLPEAPADEPVTHAGTEARTEAAEEKAEEFAETPSHEPADLAPATAVTPDAATDLADLIDLPGAREIDDIIALPDETLPDETLSTGELPDQPGQTPAGSAPVETPQAEDIGAPAEDTPKLFDDDDGLFADEEDTAKDATAEDDAAGPAAVAEAAPAQTLPAETPPAETPPAGIPLTGLQPPEEPAPSLFPEREARITAHDADIDTSRLSKPEREAFRKIAEALGARSASDEETQATGHAPREPVTPDTAPPAQDRMAAAPDADAEAPGEQAAEIPASSAPSAPEPSNISSLGIIPRVQAPAPRAARTSLLDKLPVGVAIIAEDDVDYANATLLDLLGYADLETLKSVGGLDAVFAEPEDWPSTLPGAMTERTMRIRLADGGTKPVKARLHTVPWKEGTALMMSLLDRHDPAQEAALDRLHEAQSSLALAEEHLAEMDAVLETATDGVLILDETGRIVKVNRSAEALFDAAREDMVGALLTEFLAPESHRDANDYLDGLARNGVASVLNDGREVIGQLRSGGLIPLFMTIGRVGHGSEGPRFCTVLRDITQWKTAEEELTDAKRQAENASSQKSDFLAKISHEIRTPLNAIIGFSEVMMEERFGPVGNDRYKGYLRDIHNSGSHIMSLINDLLDLSKIEAGKLDLTFEAVSANDIIRECVALMQPQANRERVIIRASLPTSVPKIVADGRSVRQIVLNLLSNAIKFNQPGGQVIVSTALEDTGEVILRVRDTGMGMSHQDLAAAMEPFRQLHTARHGGGTGLGLPLTKALVEANRASFRIDSEVNHGTLVEVTFPPQRVLAE